MSSEGRVLKEWSVHRRVSFDGAAGTELGYIKALSVRVKLGGLGHRKMIKGINRTGRGFFWGGCFIFFNCVDYLTNCLGILLAAIPTELPSP